MTTQITLYYGEHDGERFISNSVWQGLPDVTASGVLAALFVRFPDAIQNITHEQLRDRLGDVCGLHVLLWTSASMPPEWANGTALRPSTKMKR